MHDYKTREDRLGLNLEQKTRLQALALDVMTLLVIIGLIAYVIPSFLEVMDMVAQ